MDTLNRLKLRWHSSFKVNKLREKRRRWFSPNKDTKIIFVFGCQRSGTTLIQKLIALNPDVKMIGEGEQPYFYPPTQAQYNRIKSVEEIKPKLREEIFGQIILKPLYDSQSAKALISVYPGSKAVWIFRHYLDVIDSHIHYYNYNAHDYIRPFYSKKTRSWLNECIPVETLDFINQFNPDDISEADAYALFWIVRNSLYWNARNKTNVFLVNYERLVLKTSDEIFKLCDFLELPPHKFYNNFVKTNAISKTVSFILNPEIESKCLSIYQQLLRECQ